VTLKKPPQKHLVKEDHAAARLVTQPRDSIRKTDPEPRKEEKYRNEHGIGATIPSYIFIVIYSTYTTTDTRINPLSPYIPRLTSVVRAPVSAGQTRR